MPVFLKAPRFSNLGPDGGGLNRLRVDAIDPAPQCALRPKTYVALRESYENTLRAAWGPYKECVNSGKCENCPIGARSETLQYNLRTEESVIVRECGHQGEPHLMDNLEDGWGAYGEWGFDWESLNRDCRFVNAKFGSDEHSRFVVFEVKLSA